VDTDPEREARMTRQILTACLPWAGLLEASLGLLAALGRAGGARLRFVRLRRLHRDESGSAQSLSFVLTLPLFIMVVLLIVQISQLMIGTVVVHYAAFAAARSAVVWIPARLDDETELENCVGQYTMDPSAPDQAAPVLNAGDAAYGPAPGGMTFRIAPGGRKYEKIKAAAVMACLPICPSREVGSPLSAQGAYAAELLASAFEQWAPSALSSAAVPRRMRNKVAYGMENTDIEVRFFHANAEPPLVAHGLTTVPPRAAEFWEGRELGWQDPVTVTVRHAMALLPGPGRLLAKREVQPGGGRDEVAESLQRRGSLYVYPLEATATLGLEGEKSVLPYPYGD